MIYGRAPCAKQSTVAQTNRSTPSLLCVSAYLPLSLTALLVLYVRRLVHGTDLPAYAREVLYGRVVLALTAALTSNGTAPQTLANASLVPITTGYSASSAKAACCSTLPATSAPVPALQSGTAVNASLPVVLLLSTQTVNVCVQPVQPQLTTRARPMRTTAVLGSYGMVVVVSIFLVRLGISLMGRLAFNMFRIVRYRPIGMDWLVLLLTFNVRVGLSGMGPSVLLCRPVPKGSISVAVNVYLFLCCASRSIPGTALIACQQEQPPPASKPSSTTAPPVSLSTAPPGECGHHSTTNASATAPHSGTD